MTTKITIKKSVKKITFKTPAIDSKGNEYIYGFKAGITVYENGLYLWSDYDNGACSFLNREDALQAAHTKAEFVRDTTTFKEIKIL